MRNTKKDLCENFRIRLPFFNVKPENIEGLLAGGNVSEIIATAICIPYLEKRQQYRNHIPGCKECKQVYEEFLERMSEETGLSKEKIDSDYLGISTRL